MAETPYTKYRLEPDILADLDVLRPATGSRTESIRQCVRYWCCSVLDAAVSLRDLISPDDWRRLANVGLPAVDGDDYPHWGVEMAEDLRSVAGRSPQPERGELLRLAKVCGRLSLAEGWWVWAALTRHAADPDADGWWKVEQWLDAGAGEGDEGTGGGE